MSNLSSVQLLEGAKKSLNVSLRPAAAEASGPPVVLLAAAEVPADAEVELAPELRPPLVGVCVTVTVWVTVAGLAFVAGLDPAQAVAVLTRVKPSSQMAAFRATDLDRDMSLQACADGQRFLQARPFGGRKGGSRSETISNRVCDEQERLGRTPGMTRYWRLARSVCRYTFGGSRVLGSRGDP